jgi:hypothetical protein
VSQAPERVPREAERGRIPVPPLADERPGPPGSRAELRCRRCHKPIRDLEMELYFLQTGLCFWCAYVDSQG